MSSQFENDIGPELRRHRSSDFYDSDEVRARVAVPPPPPPADGQPSTGRFLRTEYEGARGVQAPRQAPKPLNPLRRPSSEHRAVSAPNLRENRGSDRYDNPHRPNPGSANGRPSGPPERRNSETPATDYLAAVADVEPRPIDTFSATSAEAREYQDNLGHEGIPSDTLPTVQQAATSPLVWSPGSTTQSEVIANRYLIRNPRNDLLGTGAKGVVYKAYDTNLGGRKVAVKLFFDAFGDFNDPELIEEEKNRTEREVEIQGELAHPGIVTIYDRFESDHGAGVVLEFVDGETLEERIERLKVLPIGDAVRFNIELAKAVEFMHQLGFIHRDIKPGNVLITKDENAKLIDFGLSKQKNGKDPFDNSVTRQLKLSDESVYKTQEGDIVGTPAYMSPEQASGRLREVDEASDVYGLGAILFHCLTGQPPVNKDTIEEVLDLVIEGGIDNVRAVNSDIDPALEAIVMKSLALERSDRFQSALSLREQLVRYQDGKQLDRSVYREPFSKRVARWVYNHQTFFIVVFTLVIGISILLGGYKFFLKLEIEAQTDSQLKDIKLAAVRGSFAAAQSKLAKFQEAVPNHPETLPLLTELQDATRANNLVVRTRRSLKEAELFLENSETDKAENKYALAELTLNDLEEHIDNWKSTKASKDNKLYRLVRVESLFNKEWFDQSLLLARGLTPFSIATPQSSDSIALTSTIELHRYNERMEIESDRFEFETTNGKTNKMLVPVIGYRLPLGIYQAHIKYNSRSHWFPVKIERGKKVLKPMIIGQIPEPPPGMAYVFGRKGFRPGHVRHDNLDRIDVKPFFVMQNEVTIKQYLEFLEDVGSRQKELALSYKPYTWFGLQPPPNLADTGEPVTDVSIKAAIAYAVWLERKTGLAYRLPTEGEWQLAASGGVQDRDYPYGQRFRSDWSVTTGDKPKKCGAQVNDMSPYGVFDLGGNVSEWIQPPPSLPKNRFLVKGGSFKGPAPLWSREIVKQSSRSDIGFRCVITAPEIEEWKPSQ